MAPAAGQKFIAFPKGSGMDDYVLRVDNHLTARGHYYQDDDFQKRLLGSTHLTPVNRHILQTNIGQPLMALDKDAEISILLRQPGTSWSALQKEFEEQHRHSPHKKVEALIALMDHVLAIEKRTGRNPFLTLYAQAYELRYAGFETDTGPGNVLFNEKTDELNFIDPLSTEQHWYDFTSKSSYARAEVSHCHTKLIGCFTSMLNPKETTSQLVASRTQRLQQVLKLAEAARDQVLMERTVEPERYQPAFVKTKNVQAIALSDAPYALKQQLQKFHQPAQSII